MEDNNQIKDNEKNVDDSNENVINNDTEYEDVDTIIVDNYIEETDTEKIQIRDIDLKLQELEIKIDEFEFNNIDISNLDEDKLIEYEKLKQEYKDLLKQKKQLKKEKKSNLSDNDIEQSSPWIFLYGTAMDIFTFPLVCYTIYFKFGSWIIEKFITGTINSTGFFYKLLIWLIVFLLPILLIALTWFIYGTFVKKKIDKKIFSIFWIVQGLFTLGTIIWLTIALGIFNR